MASTELLTLHSGTGRREKEGVPILPIKKKNLRNARGLIYEGPVKMYDFNPRVSVPVERKQAHVLMDDIFCKGEEVIISPEGYVLTTDYSSALKPGEADRDGVSRRDAQSGLTWFSTEKGITRPWMMDVPAFREELKAQGWTFIPKVEELDEREKVALDKKFSRVFKRPLDLETIRVFMQMTAEGEEKKRYALAVDDLGEVTDYLTNVDLVYEGGGRSFPLWILRGEATLRTRKGERRANMVLSDLNHIVSPNEDREYPSHAYGTERRNTLKREVNLSVPINPRSFMQELPFWWTIEHTQRVLTIADLYRQREKLDERSVGVKIDKCDFTINVKNRRDYDKAAVTNPNTGKLLRQAFGLYDCIERVITMEREEYANVQKDVLVRRRAQLGL